MKISKQSRRDAKQLFQSCISGGLLDPNRVRQIVQQVIAQKPRGYAAILAHFQRLLKLEMDRRNAKVESAAKPWIRNVESVVVVDPPAHGADAWNQPKPV